MPENYYLTCLDLGKPAQGELTISSIHPLKGVTLAPVAALASMSPPREPVSAPLAVVQQAAKHAHEHGRRGIVISAAKPTV